ncbi:MAG: sodium-dependent transporter [Myxococcota bacterium]
MEHAPSSRGSFGRIGFILAATGSAVGLGNLWKFPYMTYANDGGSFVVVYLVSVVLIGAPLMMAEIMIGRRAQASPVGALKSLSDEVRASPRWALAGWLGIAAGFVILAYYSVVAGWTVYYVGKCLSWSLTNFDPEAVGPGFGSFVGDGRLQLLFHGLFMAMTMGVVLGGVQDGIERVTKILMPMLGVLLTVLVVNSFFQPGFSKAMSFLFHVGPITFDGVLEAVGQSFFSLSLGMGAMITYGSYVSKSESIPRAALTVVAFDTLVGFMACFVMLTIIFSAPDPSSFSASAAILFTTMPIMFYEMAGGAFLAPLFYFLVSAAALSSTISLLEVVVAYFIDNRGWSRRRSVIVVGSLIYGLGVPAGLSLGASSLFTSFLPVGTDDAGETVYMGFFDILDYLATNWLLPVGGLFIAVFVGWVLTDKASQDEMASGHGTFRAHAMWKWSLRVVCPLAIVAIVFAVLSGRTFN